MDDNATTLSADSNLSSSNLLGDKIEVPGGPDDPNMKEGDDELSQANSVLLKDPQQQYLYAVETVRQLRARLIRRTNVIDEIRKFYLRDIVAMRNIIKEVLTEPEREAVFREYEAALPSIDLSQMLKLHAPPKGEFRIRPCEKCGGQLEIVERDTDEVEQLKRIISDSKERENRWREKLAGLDAQIEDANREKAENSKTHQEEKRVLYAEMKKLRDALDKAKHEAGQSQQMYKRIKDDYDGFKRKNADLFEASRKLELMEQEMRNAKANIEEKEKLIENLKTQERNISRDLQIARESIQEMTAELEQLDDDLTAAKQENTSLQNTLTSVNSQLLQTENNYQELQKTHQVVETKLETTQHEMLDMRITHAQIMETTAHEMDTLKYELKELSQTFTSTDNQLEEKKKELSEALAKIDELTDQNQQLELELLDSADEIELFEEEIAAMQQFIREKISLQGGNEEEEDDLMREFEEQFRGKLEGDDDEGEDESDEDIDQEEEEVKAKKVAKRKGDSEKSSPKGSEEEEEEEESSKDPPEKTVPPIKIKKQKTKKRMITKSGSRRLPLTDVEKHEVESKDNEDENEEGVSEEQEEEEESPGKEAAGPPKRERGRTIVSRQNSLRKESRTGHTSAAALRKQIRGNSFRDRKVSTAPTSSKLQNIPDVTDETILEEETEEQQGDEEKLAPTERSEGNSRTTTARSTFAEEDYSTIASSRRKTKTRTRAGSIMERPKRNSRRASTVQQKRRSIAVDRTEVVNDDPIKLIDPNLLMTLNHRGSFFGVPNEKVALQRTESVRRRRSIPRDFIYYDLKKSPSFISIPVDNTSVEATGAPTITTTQEDQTGSSERKPLSPKQVRKLDKNFTLYTREILSNAKGRIENIKQMLQETPPTTARSLKSGGGGGGDGSHDRKRRKTKDGGVAEEDRDDEIEEDQQPKESKRSNSKKPPSGRGGGSASNKKSDSTTSDKTSGKAGGKVVVPTVELLPPPEDASKFELAFRQCLLTVIRTTKGLNENFTHTVMNGITPVLHQICGSIYQTLESLWSSVGANKTALDFFEKLSIVLKGILSLNHPEADTASLADVCAEIVPLAGTTLNAGVTQQWQEQVQLDEEILMSLLPTVVNYGTGERRPRSLPEYLEDSIQIYPYNPKVFTAIEKKDPQNPNLNPQTGIDETIFAYPPKFSQLMTTIQKMTSHTAKMNTTLSEQLIDVLRDWSTAKTIFLELERRLEQEREKTKKPLEMKISTISKELTKVTNLYEKTLETQRKLEMKLTEYEKYEQALKNCEIKLIDTQQQLESSIQQHLELTKSHQTISAINESYKKDLEAFEALVAKLNEQIVNHLQEISDCRQRIEALEAALQGMTSHRDDLQAKYDHAMYLEDRRLHQIFPVAVQTEPLVADIGLQTEFFIPPMDLKTVVVNKLSRSGLRKYPLVFSQSVDFLPKNSTSTGSGTDDLPANDHPERSTSPWRYPSSNQSVASSTGVGSISIAEELVHPLVLGLNPNHTNTNTLSSKLRTNEALANPQAFLKKIKVPPPINTNYNPNTTAAPTPTAIQASQPGSTRNSLYRSDTARSTDSLQFNLTEFRAAPPIITYQYSPHKTPAGGSFASSTNNSQQQQQHYYNHPPSHLPGGSYLENSIYEDYHEDSNSGGDFQTLSSHDSLLYPEQPSQSHQHHHYPLQQQSSMKSSQQPIHQPIPTLSPEKSMPKLYKASSYHHNSNTNNNSNNTTALNQASLLTVSTIHPTYQTSPTKHPPTSEVITDASFETLPTTTGSTQKIGPSIRKSNQHQDIINGIIYNHRANNHYSNALYKTSNMNDALAVKDTYQHYYQTIEDTMDVMSVTSLSQANRVALEAQKNALPINLSQTGHLVTAIKPSSNRASPATTMNQATNTNNTTTKKKLLFPEIEARTGSQGRSTGPSTTVENTIRKLQKELF